MNIDPERLARAMEDVFPGWLEEAPGSAEAQAEMRSYAEQLVRAYAFLEDSASVDAVRVSTSALIVVMSRFCFGRYGEAPTPQEWRDMLARAASVATVPGSGLCDVPLSDGWTCTRLPNHEGVDQ